MTAGQIFWEEFCPGKEYGWHESSPVLGVDFSIIQIELEPALLKMPTGRKDSRNIMENVDNHVEWEE